MDCANERGTPSRGCNKSVLKCFYLFYFSAKNRSWDATTENTENSTNRIC